MYENKQASHAIVRGSNAFDTAENLAATAADYGIFYVMRPIKVTGFYFYVTTAMVSDTLAASVALTRRITPGSDTGAVVISTMAIPDLTAAGKVVYEFVEPVLVYPGDNILCDHTVQCTSATTAAGAGFYGFDYEVVSETVSNCGDWVAAN